MILSLLSLSPLAHSDLLNPPSRRRVLYNILQWRVCMVEDSSEFECLSLAAMRDTFLSYSCSGLMVEHESSLSLYALRYTKSQGLLDV